MFQQPMPQFPGMMPMQPMVGFQQPPQFPQPFQQPNMGIPPQQPVYGQQMNIVQLAEQGLQMFMQMFTDTVRNYANQNTLQGAIYNVVQTELAGQSPQPFLVMLAEKIGRSLISINLASNPAVPLQNIVPNIVSKAYDIARIVWCMQKPELVSSLGQGAYQLAGQIPELQNIVNQAFGQGVYNLQLPGFQVQQQLSTMQPQMMMQPPMHQPVYGQQQPVQSYGLSTAQQMPMHQTMPSEGFSSRDAYGRDYHNGMSGSRPQVATVGDDEYTNVVWTKGGETPVTEPVQRQVQQPYQQEEPISISPTMNAQFASAGVVQEFSTPGLTQTQQTYNPQQFQALDPMDIMGETKQFAEVHGYNGDDMAGVMPLSPEEEFDLFNGPMGVGTGQEIYNAASGVPGSTEFNEIFAGQQNNWDKYQQQAPVPPAAILTETHPAAQAAAAVVKQEVEQAQLRNSQATLSEDKLPDGWLYAEHAKNRNHFLETLRGRKFKDGVPLPIAHHVDITTLLYRINPNGEVEQKVVGATVDRLNHDISKITAPVTNDLILTHEVFEPLKPMSSNEAISIIKEEEEDTVKVAERFKEADLFTVGETFIANTREEASLIAAGRCAAIGKTYASKHGYEYHFREAKIIGAMPNADEQFVSDELLSRLTDSGNVRNIIELGETIRVIRAEQAVPKRVLKSFTDNVIHVLNDILTYDYAYAGELFLESKELLEDELVEFVVFMDSVPEHKEVLDLIHERWDEIITRICNILTGKEREEVTKTYGKRLVDDAPGISDVLDNLIITETLHSVTTLKYTAEELGITGQSDIFAVASNITPYLYGLMKNTLSRCPDDGKYYDSHRITTHDGVSIDFRRGGLGDRSIFIANLV